MNKTKEEIIYTNKGYPNLERSKYNNFYANYYMVRYERFPKRTDLDDCAIHMNYLVVTNSRMLRGGSTHLTDDPDNIMLAYNDARIVDNRVQKPIGKNVHISAMFASIFEDKEEAEFVAKYLSPDEEYTIIQVKDVCVKYLMIHKTFCRVKVKEIWGLITPVEYVDEYAEDIDMAAYGEEEVSPVRRNNDIILSFKAVEEYDQFLIALNELKVDAINDAHNAILEVVNIKYE